MVIAISGSQVAAREPCLPSCRPTDSTSITVHLKAAPTEMREFLKQKDRMFNDGVKLVPCANKKGKQRQVLGTSTFDSAPVCA